MNAIHAKPNDAKPPRVNQSGFSLLETLLALAIMSVASLALFQSTSSLLRLSDRTVNAALKAQDLAVGQKSFAALVGGLVLNWPDAEADKFVGTARMFSGLTRTPFHSVKAGLYRFSLTMENNGSGTSFVYRSDGVEWVLREFPAADGQFSYLGADNVWRPAWPPKETPEPGDFGDAKFYDPPTLPLAIRLRVSKAGAARLNASAPDDIIWIVSTGTRDELPDLTDI